jgi:hypothetical protein
VPPIGQAAVLKTHHGEMIRHGAADHAVASQLVQQVHRQPDLGIGQQVFVIYM